jgi:hypothetical protein
MWWMTSPPDDTATTWRELVDQLRPEQIAELDGWERGGYEAAALLFTARVWTAENVSDTRGFTTVASRFGRTAIYVSGRQFDDGRCERWITLRADETDRLSAERARELAALLTRAADEIE